MKLHAKPLLRLPFVFLAAVGCGNYFSAPKNSTDEPKFKPTPQVQDVAGLTGDELAEVIPPPFHTASGLAVAIDITHLDVSYDFDVAKQTAKAVATFQFKSLANGLPLLDIWPDAQNLTFDGETRNPTSLRRVTLPDGKTRARVLDVSVTRGDTHTVEIAYDLPADSLAFSPTGVSFMLSMSDMGTEGSRYFLERYAPANFEFDQFPMSFTFKVSHATKPHVLFANGESIALKSGEGWHVEYPDYFTSSSPYLHLSERPFITKTATYKGRERSFPVTVYAVDSKLAEEGLRRALENLSDLEADYGAYAHEELLIYVTDELHDNGMEYAGATITDLLALSHEVAHSWFARSVMPGNGNAGWIDEAVVSWREDGYPRHELEKVSTPPGLGAGSPYKRDTNDLAYTAGSALLGGLDNMFASHGEADLKEVLAELYAVKKNHIISTSYFQNFLEQESKIDLHPYFQEYVYDRPNEMLMALPRQGRHRPLSRAVLLRIL